MGYNQFMPNGMPVMYTPQQSFGVAPTQQVSYAPIDPNPYMIQVDGEAGARAKQIVNLQPGMVVPLWDINGRDIYFRSMNQYGQLNPLRKGHFVMDDDPILRLSETASSEREDKPAVNEDTQRLEKRIAELESMVQKLTGDIHKRGAATNGDV